MRNEEATSSTPTDEAAIDAAVVAVADEVSKPETEETDFLAELGKLQHESVEPKFGSLDDVFKVEDAEQLGVWCQWPELPDAEFLIAHTSAAVEKRENLEAKYRERNNVAIADGSGLPTRLPRRVNEALFRESLYGTAIKGWRGKSLDGFAFNVENFRRLVNSRRFRMFFLAKATSAETFRAKREDAISGNS